MLTLKKKATLVIVLAVMSFSTVACGDTKITVDGHTTTPNQLVEYNKENNQNVLSPMNQVWSD